MQRVTDAVLLRLGGLPALPVVAVEYALTALAVVVLSKSAATAVGVVLLVVLTVYCYARPEGGWSVWGAAAAPAAVGSIVATFGGPRWVGLFVLPVTFLMLWALDHDTPGDGNAERGGDPVTRQPG